MDVASQVLAVPLDPDAAVGTLILARSGGTRVLVARHAQGWTAALDLCPHARCSLKKMGEVVEGTILVCNCHGSEFDLLTGAVLRDPAEEPLTLLEAALSEDGCQLLVTLSA